MRNKTMRAMASTITLSLLTASLASAAPGPAEIYKAKCASCHAADGSGQTPAGKSLKARDLRSPEVQKQSDADLLKIMADGKGKMPAYKTKLSMADITSLVAFIRGLAKQ